ncbi:MAG: ABC transporter permease [Phycisphaerales bacterium JB063]
MLTYIIRRLLLMIPTLLGVTVLVFFIMAYAPGGFASVLNEGGGQSMGVEARRLKQYNINRYGLDKPKIVQYLRWLNQVSPVGFKMSGDYEWTDKEREALAVQLAQRDWAGNEQSQRQLAELILTTAIFAGIEPDDALARYDDAADSATAMVTIEPVMATDGQPAENDDGEPLYTYTGAGPELFELIDATPIDEHNYWTQVRAASQADHDEAVAMLHKELGYGAINKSRMMFTSIDVGTPDFGTNRNNGDVAQEIFAALKITLLMNLITIPIIYLVSVTSGVFAARRRGGAFDVGSGFIMLALYSVPVIWAGTLLISYLANADNLRWFPASGVHDIQADDMPFLPTHGVEGWEMGWLLDMTWHLVLPILCLTYTGFAFLTKVMRGSMLENISSDFVRTARAKGVSEHDVLFRHVLRNALLPLITMAAAILPGLFVGSFVVEYIFSINGMGKLTIEAAKNADINVVMATTLVGSVLSLFSLLVRDILYAVVDPRVSYE